MSFLKKIVPLLLIVILLFSLTLIYLFPLVQGLILLPLDLLVTQYRPWYSPATILLKNPYMQDSVIQLFPWKHLVFQSFQNNIIPLWNPYQFMGMPFMASMKPMVFYPLNILFLLGEVNAWNALLFLQIFLSMIFSYILSREFKLGFFPSILASFAFSLNSLMIGVLEFGSEGHVLLWLPILLFCSKKYLENKKGKYLLILGMSLAVSILAGQLQYTGYMLLMITGFIIFYGYVLKSKASTYCFLFLGIALGIGISAIQLFPGVELFTKSYRGLADSYAVFSSGLLNPFHLFRLLAPDFFGNPVTKDSTIGYIEQSGYFGIIPLFFCIYSMIFLRKNNFVKFFTIIFVSASLFSMNGIGQILYLLRVPLITSGSGERIFSLVLFSGAFLSGFGLNEFLENKESKKLYRSLTVFFSIIAVVFITAFLLHRVNGDAKAFIHNIQFSFIIFIAFFVISCIYVKLRKKIVPAKNIFLLFIIALTFFDFFRMGYRFLTFSNKKFFYSNTDVVNFVKKASHDELVRAYGLVEPELGTYLNIYTLDTYNPLYPQRSALLLQALQGRLDQKLPVNKYIINANGEKLKNTLNFLGTSLIITSKDLDPSAEHIGNRYFQLDFDLIYKDEKHSVYQNNTSYPRFGLFYQYKEVKNDSEILKLIAENSLNFRKILILEEKIPFSLDGGSGSAQLISSTVNTQKFQVKTDKPALFYISDTFFPGWSVKVNNMEEKIYRANYNFRAVIVPAGESMVEFSYLPNSFFLGIIISVISLIILFFLSIFYRKQEMYIKVEKRKTV